MKKVRLFLYYIALLTLSGAWPLHAETNLPPPDEEVPPNSPFAAIGESNDENPGMNRRAFPFGPPPNAAFRNRNMGRLAESDSGNAAAGEVQDIFNKKDAPARPKPNSEIPITSPLFDWQWQIGGGYTLLAEGENVVYVTTGRFLHALDRATLKEVGELAFDQPIRSLFYRALGAQRFLLLVTASASPSLIVVEDLGKALDGSENLVTRQTVPLKGKLQVLPEGIFEQDAMTLTRSELKTDGSLAEGLRLLIGANDRFYPYSHFFYIYRAQNSVLELWDVASQTLLASLPLGGNPIPLMAVPMENGSAFLYFAGDTTATALPQGESIARINALYRIPINSQTGLFSGPAEVVPLSTLASDFLVDHGKNLVYLKMTDKKEWGVFDLKKAQALKGAWPAVQTPYLSRDGIYLVSPAEIQWIKLMRAAPTTSPDESDAWDAQVAQGRKDVAQIASVALDPDGKRIVFVGHESKGAPSAGYETRLQTDGTWETKRLFTDPSGAAAKLSRQAGLWFLEVQGSDSSAVRRLYVTRELDAGKWQEVTFPGFAEGKKLISSRYFIRATAGTKSFSIWISAILQNAETGTVSSEVSLYPLLLGETGIGTGEVKYRFTDLSEAFDVLPLDTDGKVLAVAAGKEGVLLLQYDESLKTLKRIHRKAEPAVGISCERLALGGKHQTLIAFYRDNRVPDQATAFFNTYDISDPKFLLFIAQMPKLSLITQEGGAAVLPDATFVHRDQWLAIVQGKAGMLLIDPTNPTAPITPAAFSEFSVTGIDTAENGQEICAATGDAGIVCGRFK